MVVEETSIAIYNALDFPPMEEVPNGSQFKLMSGRLNEKYSEITIQEEIYNVHFLFLHSLVLLVRSKGFSFLRGIILSKGYQFGQKDLRNVNPRIDNDTRISTEGRFLLSLDDANDGSQTLFETSLDSGNSRAAIALVAMYTFSTGFPLFTTKLLKGHIKTTNRNGLISIYKLPSFENQFKSQILKKSSGSSNQNSQQSYRASHNAVCIHLGSLKPVASSTFSKDLRYPNHTIFLQDWTFTSTAVSSGLLHYWHMARGREFNWLVGSTFKLQEQINDYEDESTSASYLLYNVVIGEEVNVEVTAIHVTRGILLCGTSNGRVMLYKLQEEAEKSDFNLEFLRNAPWINMPVITKQIVAISGLWTSLGLIVAVLDGKKSSTLSFLPLKIS